MYLTPDRIAHLDGRPVRLSSPYAERKLLTISPAGKITLEDPHSGYDQMWRLIPVDGGFIISSSKDGYVICHRLKDEGIVRCLRSNNKDKDCVWKVGKKGEIYQKNPEGGERYLWLADGGLYATLDGYLAENWTPLTDIELPKITKTEKSQGINILPFILVVVIMLLLLWILK